MLKDVGRFDMLNLECCKIAFIKSFDFFGTL